MTLVDAVVKHLRSALGVKPFTLDGTLLPGQPPPRCGNIFIAVCPSGHSPGPTNDDALCLDELFDVAIVITRRTGTIKLQDEFRKLYDDTIPQSFESICRSIKVAMKTYRYPILTTVNTTRSFPSGEGFIEPLRWLGTDASPTPVGPDWFNEVNDDPEKDQTQNHGHTVTMRYGGARCMQLLPGT